MIDYAKITEDEFDRRMNALPNDVRDFVSSSEFKGYVADLVSTYDDEASEELLNAFGQVRIYALLGFIKPDELAEEMLNLTSGDKELADEMATDMNELNAALLKQKEVPERIAIRTSTPPPSSLNWSGNPGAPKPFIIHSDETSKPIPGIRISTEPKNDFLKPQIININSAEPAKVKMDFGGTPKIVNYNAQTIPTNKPQAKPLTASADIHPENVIDLKDLPR